MYSVGIVLVNYEVEAVINLNNFHFMLFMQLFYVYSWM